MAVLIRAKKVFDPLDARVRARLLGTHHSRTHATSSSGSEHDAVEPSCFCGLIHAFLQIDEPDSSQTARAEVAASSCSCVKSDYDEMLRDLMSSSDGNLDLQSDVTEVLADQLISSSRSEQRREVMTKLRERGYNAGICTARWESSRGLTAGSYEYIDVMISGKDNEERYIVDLDFSAQFEIARATTEYEKLVAMLPIVMIEKAEVVKRAVRIMAEAAKRSLKSMELSVPPWRKRRYMISKWFGPYRRSVNSLLSSAGVAAVAGKENVMCRAVGFGVAPCGIAVAPPTRT